MSVRSEVNREEEAVAYLRSAEAVRARSEAVFEAGLYDELEHFSIRLDRLPDVAHEVVEVTKKSYPGLDIPYHSRFRHFGAGGVDRLAWLEDRFDGLDEEERLKSRFDLVVTSVLLDAGAGNAWSYHEERTGLALSRSEGLAVASLHSFLDGTFSARSDHPLEATADGLCSVSDEELEAGFQASESNPLVGIRGRAALMRSLGARLRAAPEFFGESGRFGNLVHSVITSAKGKSSGKRRRVEAGELLTVLLSSLAPIWPERTSLANQNLGDVFPHPQAGGEGPGSGLVPFHKLSQWLAYSLVEALERSRVSVSGVETLTGLAEYRNGGLFIDSGVLVPKQEGIVDRETAHAPESTLVVEWRALTIALLDRLAEAMRDELGMNRQSLPLAKVLEGGTWRAGRLLASRLREDAAPPIRVESDGTLF